MAEDAASTTAASAGPGVRRVAYFINLYPAVSHSFIRREIAALEAQGWEVLRYAIRHGETVDPRDAVERRRTHALLPPAWPALAASSLRLLLRPRDLLRGLRVSFRMARRAPHGLLRGLATFPHAAVLLREFQRRGVRHAHAHFVTNSASVLRVVRALGGPGYSFTVHGSFDAQPPALWSTREKITDARFVVAISAATRAEIMAVAPTEAAGKVAEIRCGLEPAPGPVGLLPDETTLVCVGRLSEEKGHLVLLRAAAACHARGARFRLRLVGDGPLRPTLEREVERLGLAECVDFDGWADEASVRAAIEASTALVLPSLSEGLPVVLMEAFQAMRPVIASRVGAVEELVEAGTSGWLVPPGDADGLAGAIGELVDTPRARLGEMGRAGADVVARRHDVHAEARALAERFEASLAEAAGR